MTEGSEPHVAAAPRILLAHDLSRASEQAAALILHATWPPATIVRVVTSPAGIGPSASSFANLREVRANAGDVRAMIADAHERLSTDLARVGLTVETEMIAGTPESAIVEEAERFEADLIVVGARGQGPIVATLLGSVSRAVVEHASCSVLVARGTTLQRVLLAIDGSASARFATSLVGSWATFAHAQILLVAVGEPPPRYARNAVSATEWRSAFHATIASSTDRACDVVERGAKDLDAAGRELEVEIRLGDVATEVAAAAREWPADLVTVGLSSGSRRPFARSVPRKVLDSVDASVLVARPPIQHPDVRT